MSGAIADFRRRERLQQFIDQALRDSFALFRLETMASIQTMQCGQNSTVAELTRLLAEQQALVAAQASIIADLQTRKQAIDLGETSITVGSLLSISTAGAKRIVNPFAGVRSNDVLYARPLVYLPDGYGLPQVTCRTAGQIEIRLTVPTLATGAPTVVSMAITAIR